MNSIQSELSRIVDAGLPGAFIYIEDVGGASKFYTSGFADLLSQQRMSPEYRYRIGSTTKTFTAIVVLQLVDEGKLALQDTVQNWLPDLSVPNADTLTIEHLMRMRSGLFDFEDDPSLIGSLDAHLKPYSLQHCVDLAIKHPAEFNPGSRYSYCNTNFCVLELIIERITGRSLSAELIERIFEPLRMTNTSYPPDDDLTLPEPYIRGYERTDEGWRECTNVFFGRGDGAILSTAIDLAKFFKALFIEHTLVPKKLLSQMMHVVPDNPPAVKAYGLGLIADPLPCGTVWGHSGAGFGYRNLPFMLIETGRFAVFMQNGTYGFRQIAFKEPPGFSNEFRALAYEL